MPQVPLADGIYPWVLYLKNFYLFLKTNPGSSVLLPGKSHGRRSLVGCSCEESDMTVRLHFHFSLSCIGEGNGNPLQCSCQENPRDGGAWWATIYGVAQSQNRLSSSSSGKESTCQNRGHEFDPWSWKIPRAMEQQSPCATTTEPACYNCWSP